MPNQHQAVTPELHRRIFELGQQEPRLSSRQIAAQLGIHNTTVMRYREEKPAEPRADAPAQESPDEIRRILKRGPATAEDLADELDCSPRRIRERIAALKAKGALILELVDGSYDLGSADLIEPGRHEVSSAEPMRFAGVEWNHVFGFVTDNHLCNRQSRLDVLRAAYDHYKSEGITTVYNAGNYIDGEARFNKTELVTAPGMDRQLEYFVNEYPQRDGITTYYIAGDDHEGWYQQREGVEIGRYTQLFAEQAGRTDLKYLGYAECDVALKHGSGAATMRVVHPGGGSAYAISYTDQKRVESYQGGEKPQIELVGHYHKFNIGYPREVHTVQGGCTCDQTLFMRKKRLQAHVGFCTVRIKQRDDGSVERFSAEWFPFFDRGYFEKRYS